MALCEQGYSARSIIRRVPILTEFAEFAAARHADRVDRAETLLDAFVVDWLSARRLDRPADARRRDRNLVRGTVRHFFSLVHGNLHSRRGNKGCALPTLSRDVPPPSRDGEENQPIAADPPHNRGRHKTPIMFPGT